MLLSGLVSAQHIQVQTARLLLTEDTACSINISSTQMRPCKALVRLDLMQSAKASFKVELFWMVLKLTCRLLACMTCFRGCFVHLTLDMIKPLTQLLQAIDSTCNCSAACKHSLPEYHSRNSHHIPITHNCYKPQLMSYMVLLVIDRAWAERAFNTHCSSTCLHTKSVPNAPQLLHHAICLL